MDAKILCVVVLFAVVGLCGAQSIPDQDWGYVDVRPQAHMFWWLYGRLNVSARSTSPLIMWLQGGPGASSTGFGNFEEIGPLDVNLKPRSGTWANVANLIFVDNPVGTGFSYVDSPSAYTVNEDQIAQDLTTLFSAFLKKYPVFQQTPFYIFSESYGGKMAASFSRTLAKAINSSQISANFQGVALGDSWINPIKFVDAWVPYLLYTSEIDENRVAPIYASINATHVALQEKKYKLATDLWGAIEGLISEATNGVSWYNILDRSGDDDNLGLSSYLKRTSDDPLTALMNGPIKTKLGIPANVSWGGQSNDVFDHLSEDFMQSVVDTVDNLLSGGLHVIVYSGNLDLICCTPGTLAWMNELKWGGLNKWKETARTSFAVNGLQVGYEKTYANLRMFFIFASGHMVPADQPEAALAMVQAIISH